jgi:hypothetical protein
MSRVIADGLSKKVLAKGLTFTGGLAAVHTQEIKDAYAAHLAEQQQEAV